MGEEELELETENPISEEQEENDGGQAGVVDSQESQAPGDDEHEGGTGEGADEAGDANRHPAAQSHQDNAAARAARIRAEAETAQRLQAQYDREVAGTGIPNPITGKPFTSFKEFQDYGKQFRREQMEAEAVRRGQPVDVLVEEQENRQYIARKRMEEAEQEKVFAEAKQKQDFLLEDAANFSKDYPDVDIVKLEKNQKFQKFAGKRLYNEPIGELYRDFVELVSETEQAAVLRVTGRQERSTGGGQAGGNVPLTQQQASQLEEWNRDHPEMKMTAKEFNER